MSEPAVDHERVIRQLSALVWSHVLHQPEPDDETPQQQMQREERNRDRRQQWDNIVDGLLSGRVTPGMVADFNVASPGALSAILAAANGHVGGV